MVVKLTISLNDIMHIYPELYIYILSNGWTMALALLVLFHIIPNIVETLAKEWNTLDKEKTRKGGHKYSKVNNLSH
jgi:flagellar biosynthesis protein FliR